jgi:hypothetical protein
MKAITREILESTETPDDVDDFYLSIPCYCGPRVPVYLRFSKSLGVLILQCAHCGMDVTMAEVGSEKDSKLCTSLE